jgi:hypothetical protein
MKQAIQIVDEAAVKCGKVCGYKPARARHEFTPIILLAITEATKQLRELLDEQIKTLQEPRDEPL